MTEKQKLLPCICGRQPTITPMQFGKDRLMVFCADDRVEVHGVGSRQTIIMWNAAMKALTEARQ